MQTYESDANIGNIKILAVDMDKTLLTDERVLPQGLDDSADEQRAEQALCHGAQGIDPIALS